MRKKISLLFLLSFLILCGGLMSFQPDDKKDEIARLMEEAIAGKLQNYKNIRLKKCKEKILKDAGNLADSTIIARAKSLKVLPDTMPRPDAPERPERPELLTPIDSTAAAPLLGNQDSLSNEEKQD